MYGAGARGNHRILVPGRLWGGLPGHTRVPSAALGRYLLYRDLGICACVLVRILTKKVFKDMNLEEDDRG